MDLGFLWHGQQWPVMLMLYCAVICSDREKFIGLAIASVVVIFFLTG